MSTILINQSQDSKPNDFGSYARFAKFPFAGLIEECNDIESICEKGIINLVGSDEIIYLNLSFPDNLNSENDIEYGWREDTPNWLLQLDVVYPDGTVQEYTNINDLAIGFQVGFVKGLPVQRVAVDMQKLKPLLTQNCFLLRIKVQRQLNDPEPLICHFGLYRTLTAIADEGEETCEESVLIQGVYYGYDCDGQWYGSINEESDFESPISIRLEGVVETEQFTKEVVETETGSNISMNSDEKAFIKLYPFTEAQARQLMKILNADVLLVNGEEWQSKSGLQKDNNQNTDWHSRIEIERLFCQRNMLGCS